MLPLLKQGSTGPLVTQWQLFLRGQGWVSVTDSGLFDGATESATRAFQKRFRLDVDGIVGNESYGRAAMLGFELTDYAASESSYPSRPSFDPLVSNMARQTLFGPLTFEPKPTASNPEAIRITNGWEQGNLVQVSIPQLIGIPGAPHSGHLSFHRKAAQQMQRLWQAWGDAGLLPSVLSFDGAYNPRFVRGGADRQVLSNHAFATAFDVNAKWNAFGAQPATEGKKGCLFALVPLANEHGFFWGGHFSRRDGMHFEVACLE